MNEQSYILDKTKESMLRAIKSRVVNKYLDDARSLGIDSVIVLSSIGSLLLIECTHPDVRGKIESSSKDWISAARELPSHIQRAIKHAKESTDKQVAQAET